MEGSGPPAPKIKEGKGAEMKKSRRIQCADCGEWWVYREEPSSCPKCGSIRAYYKGIPVGTYWTNLRCSDCKEAIEKDDTFHVKEGKVFCNSCWADEVGARGREE